MTDLARSWQKLDALRCSLEQTKRACKALPILITGFDHITGLLFLLTNSVLEEMGSLDECLSKEDIELEGRVGETLSFIGQQIGLLNGQIASFEGTLLQMQIRRVEFEWV
jgi:hypothetical protein